jgi:hypothetical protein
MSQLKVGEMITVLPKVLPIAETVFLIYFKAYLHKNRSFYVSTNMTQSGMTY